MKEKKAILVFCITLAIIYLMIAFITCEIDFTLWEKGHIAVLIFVGTLLSSFATITYWHLFSKNK